LIVYLYYIFNWLTIFFFFFQNLIKKYVAYDKNGLKLEFIPKQEPNNITVVKSIFSSNTTINQINLQIAVQKVNGF